MLRVLAVVKNVLFFFYEGKEKYTEGDVTASTDF